MKPMELLTSGRFVGEEFMAWLWLRGLRDRGSSGVEDDLTACFVDDAVQLVCEHGYVKDLSLKRGKPAESREAFEAISRGMRSCKAKMRLLAGDMEWTFTLSSMTLGFSGLKLPPSQAKSAADRLADRVFLVKELFGHIDRRYKIFLQQRCDNPNGMEDMFHAWVRDGLRGIVLGDMAPWEEPSGD